MVETRHINIRSKGQHDTINITDDISKEIRNSGITNGIVTVFCPGSTGAISTIEYEPGLKQDIREFFGDLVPYRKNWKHHQTWGDDNGSGHILSFLLKTSLTIPFTQSSLTLGTWQQVVFCECDTRSRNRQLVLQIIGE